MPEVTSPAPKPLGLVTLTALVVGNMVGSGVFLLPAALAPYGGVSFLGWLVTAAGSMLIGLVFARLARRSPAAGGPYGYTREAFGDFAGFVVGWGYWISCWSAQAAIAVAMVGYLGELVPGLAAAASEAGSMSAAAAGSFRPGPAGTAIAAIVLLTGVNVAGVKQAGVVQVITTVLKLLPLVAISLFGFARFDRAHFEPFNPSGDSPFAATQACLALTLWAFLGLEAGTVPAGEVRDPKRTIARATLLGITIATVLYVVSTFAVMGMVPREVLGKSTAPFADAARALWGPGAGKLVAAGAFISCFGALNGWILVTGQMSLAMARDRVFPAFFQRLSRRGTPGVGLVLASALACALVSANYTETLVTMFTYMILLSTLASLIPFVFCAMADVSLALRARRSGAPEPLVTVVIVAFLAFGYGLLAIGGAGHETVFWGFLLILAGLPFYVLARARRSA